MFVAAWVAGHAAQRPDDAYVEGDVIVTWRPEADLTTAQAAAQRHGAAIKDHFPWLSARQKHVVGVVRSSSQSTAALIRKLQDDPAVLVAEPNYIRRVASLQPNDPSFTNLWGLRNTGQVVNSTTGTANSDIRFIAAWNLARRGSTDGIVGVIDTGMDPAHPDIAANVWMNPAEIPRNGIDDDANGYVDDLLGYNFAEGNADVFDSGNHGTHVCGTVAAAGNNSLGIMGVDFKAKIMTLKVSPDGDAITSGAFLAAVQYATMMKARGVNIVALNASFGGSGYSSAEATAIQTAGSLGIVLCVAAGNAAADNDVYKFYPASYRRNNMIVVAAANQNYQLATYSNFGRTSVDLAAPGDNIYSLSPAARTASVTRGGTNYAATGMTFSGFSPGVSGSLVNCGTGNTPAEFPAAVANNIALIQRGTETFNTKVTHAMNAGARAAIIYNHVAGSFGGTLASYGTWIPAVSVSQADGTSLLGYLGQNVTVKHALGTGNYYRFSNGTSMAAPHVAGAVAFAARNFPGETAAQRVARIVNHTTPVAGLGNKVISGGCLNMLGLIDTDANTLPDWWEQEYFGHLAVNVAGDSDGDGMTEWQEYLAGTHPFNGNSRLAITSAVMVPNGPNKDFRIGFPSVAGVDYRAEYSDSLGSGTWFPLGAALTGTGGLMHVTDPAANTRPQRFYRIHVVP